MTFSPRDWFRGALIVAARDFTSNAKSVRVLVITILTLLVMVGAAFGFSGLGAMGPGAQYEDLLWAYPVDFDGNGTADGIIGWVSDAFGAPSVGFEVSLGERVVNPDDLFIERQSFPTNLTGWVAFSGLGPGDWPLQTRVGGMLTSSILHISAGPLENLTAILRPFDILRDGSYRDIALHAVFADGKPVSGAITSVDDVPLATTDANGFWGNRFDPGDYVVNLTAGNETLTFGVHVNEPQPLVPLFAGPDSVLYFLAFGLMSFFAPIVAIAASYDALAKERMQGSLELLLVRPATREGLAVGKFLGTFLSVAVPMFAVLLASLAGIAALTTRWPDATFAGAFIGSTLALLATYVLIMQVLSTFVKSPGTAILSAILVWVVFNILWSVVVVLIQSILGIQGATPAAFLLAAVTALFNPTGVYQLTLLSFLPPTLFSGGVADLPDWTGPVAFAVWIAALLVLSVLLFRKRIV